MRIEKVPTGENPPWDINVLIEIPAGGPTIKYEFDKDSGALYVDRVLTTAMHYPCNYGFVPHTLAEDGDEVDALVVGHEPVVHGCVFRARPVGVLNMEDEAGQDQKVLCVPVDALTPYYRDIKRYDDLPTILIEQIKHFFAHYKDLEPKKWVRVGEWGSPEEAAKLIEEGIGRWSANQASRRPDHGG